MNKSCNCDQGFVDWACFEVRSCGTKVHGPGMGEAFHICSWGCMTVRDCAEIIYHMKKYSLPSLDQVIRELHLVDSEIIEIDRTVAHTACSPDNAMSDINKTDVYNRLLFAGTIMRPTMAPESGTTHGPVALQRLQPHRILLRNRLCISAVYSIS